MDRRPRNTIRIQMDCTTVRCSSCLSHIWNHITQEQDTHKQKHDIVTTTVVAVVVVGDTIGIPNWKKEQKRRVCRGWWRKQNGETWQQKTVGGVNILVKYKTGGNSNEMTWPTLDVKRTIDLTRWNLGRWDTYGLIILSNWIKMYGSDYTLYRVNVCTVSEIREQ